MQYKIKIKGRPNEFADRKHFYAKKLKNNKKSG
jgi:hypothetical protein